MKPKPLILAVLLLLSSAALAADVTGTWQVTIANTAPDGTVQKDTGVAMLKQSGDLITGSVGPNENQLTPIAEGVIKESKITLKASPRPDRTITLELTVTGEKLLGTVERPGDNLKGTVEFVRKP